MGLPSNAPLRSTKCKRRHPCSTHCAAIATGSSENTVESSITPWRKRTHWPSFRSMAGIINMFKSLNREFSIGNGGGHYRSAQREENRSWRDRRRTFTSRDNLHLSRKRFSFLWQAFRLHHSTA